MNRLRTFPPHRHARRLADNARGAVAIEFALLLPVLVLLFFGLINLTKGYSASRKLVIATNTFGDLVTQAGGTLSKSIIKSYYQAVGHIMRPFSAAKVKMTVYAVQKNSTGKIRVAWKDVVGDTTNTCPAPDFNSTTLKKKITPLLTSTSDMAVVTRGCYIFQPLLSNPFFTFNGVKLMEDVVLKPRQMKNLPCSDCSS